MTAATGTKGKESKLGNIECFRRRGYFVMHFPSFNRSHEEGVGVKGGWSPQGIIPLLAIETQGAWRKRDDTEICYS
jgi:hypothetical protein